RIAAVVGFAGAGKSTMLAAAREAWEAQGYQVHGAALAGKAAEGLEESSGIQSRTLASWSYSWDHGRDLIGRRDVFVIDEAGMVG
ncbi:AAA family ATPase, partial [Staphylococcus aureus]|uniref:AAA family ATPase n=2 Tax=Bacteria TaxID=2 RepID=UPI0038B2CD45